MVPDQPGIGEELIRALVGFPKYALEWTVGLIIAIITDLHITSLAVTGILGGFVFDRVVVGLFIFFVAYAVSRIVSYVANSVGSSGIQIASSINQASNVYAHLNQKPFDQTASDQ